MHFFKLIRQEMQGTLQRLVIISSVAGASNAAALATISFAAQAAGDGKMSGWMAVLFVVSLFVFVKAQDYLLVASTNEIGAIVYKLQTRLADQVRQSELLILEGIGRPEILNAIVGHTTTLTQAAYSMALAGQGLAMLFFVAIYIAYLSPLVFVLSAAIIAAVLRAVYVMNHAHAAGALEASALEDRMFDRLTDFLDGFKEVRLSQPRSAALFEHTVDASSAAANVKIRTQTETFRGTIFAQSSLYGLLGIMIFAVPSFIDAQGDAIANATLPLIFLIGTCFGAIQSIPVLAAANAATDSIIRLEARLRSARHPSHGPPAEPAKSFDKVEMRDVVFRRIEESSDAIFQVGPLNFTLQSGDMVFITGGNGSGKSTFLKLLSGLYEPDSGDVIFDGMRVNDRTRENYQNLIAAIFSDYHLFHRLYGIPEANATGLDRLLTYFGLDRKTGIVNGEFTTLDLSAGQRRRLALIVSLLEQRPILLLDEWTAEQDPDFRRKFYEDLLPQLSRAGTTVVMVTHDERHLDKLTFPSRRLRMDEGQFVEQNTAGSGE
jgi:putative ATP-binding cassette transporter